MGLQRWRSAVEGNRGRPVQFPIRSWANIPWLWIKRQLLKVYLANDIKLGYWAT